MNRKFEAGKRVAGRLFPAENSIDEALIANATFQIALVSARRDAQQPCGTIQAALAGAVSASQALIEARRATVEAHAEIVRLRDEMGLPTTGYGCMTPCLVSEEPETRAHLQAV